MQDDVSTTKSSSSVVTCAQTLMKVDRDCVYASHSRVCVRVTTGDDGIVIETSSVFVLHK